MGFTNHTDEKEEMPSVHQVPENVDMIRDLIREATNHLKHFEYQSLSDNTRDDTYSITYARSGLLAGWSNSSGNLLFEHLF